MAVYTDVTADDLNGFLGGYGIGELLSYKGIAEGVENSNFLVHTIGGNFILTLYEKRVAEGDLPFFLGDKLSGLIDFYFACTDTLAYDVAVCLNAWCFEADHSYNVTKGQALLRAYAKVRKLSDEERTALPVLARGAAMRFLLTRLVDWLAVPDGALVKPKDPLEYHRKLRFHQSVKSVGDYGFDGA